MAATSASIVESPKQKWSRRLSQPFVYLVALMVVGIAVAPVTYVMIGGFRSNLQITENPAALPDPWIFSNYTEVLPSGRFWGQAWTSTVVAVGPPPGFGI